jgi:membrane-bound lytic murein transglycosylase B
MKPSRAIRAVLSISCVLAAPPIFGQAIAPDDPRVGEARSRFLDRMVAEHDFDRAALGEVLESAVIDETVLAAISRPAERVVPWYEYRGIFLNDRRIDAGVSFWREHTDLLAEVAARYGVEPQMILAIVGIESLFGERMGRYRVLDSLSTLAFAYPPRASFFASELEAFLITSREEGPEFLNALGSYAGAMGAGQFISSSYRAYAVDGDGDGRRDLWEDWDDILPSVANYFARHGWRSGELVAVPASRSRDSAAGEPGNGLDLNETVASLFADGYAFEADLESETPAMIMGLEADADSKEYWVGFHNFRVITRYNRSVKYALAAYQLSQAIEQAYSAESL